MKLLKIEDEWEKLRNLKKDTFTRKMKLKVREFTFNEMMKTKSNNTKLKNTVYRSLKTQEYLVASDVSEENMLEVLKYRTHMLDFHQNFKGQDETRVCPVCRSHPDSQDSVEDCIELNKTFANLQHLKRLYNEKFDEDTMKLLNEVMKARKRLLEENYGNG